jgi:hypothetical protein
VKDRLSYRSAPLGLLSRRAFPDLRFAENLASGEDLPYVTQLWFTGNNIAFDRTGPAYLGHADAVDRVTAAPRSIVEDFAFFALIVNAEWARVFSTRQRVAIGIKMLRGHVLDAIVNRAKTGMSASERDALWEIANRISAWSRGSEKYLSVLDRKVFEGIRNKDVTVERLMKLISKRWNYRSLDVIVTRNPFLVFHRQAPLRTYISAYFI